MHLLNTALDTVRNGVRAAMRQIATGLNSITGGRLHPNTVTLTGLLAHAPIAWLIARQRFGLAAVLLVIFGLFDSLDGELARLQKRSSSVGMLLDSTTDRMKEVLLYSGAAYAIVAIGRPFMSFWAVLACGASLLVSYINAWGEVVLAQQPASKHTINQTFRGGLMRFEIRILFLIVGLLSNRLLLAVILIATLSSLTALSRLTNISARLKHG